MSVETRRLVWLQRWLALCAMALVGATWRLWTTSTDFPRIPWISWLRWVPGWWDWAALALLVAALIFILALAPWREGFRWPRWRLAKTVNLVAAGGLLLLLDQHRLQPWAWQFAWVMFVLITVRGDRAVILLRWLTIGIYFWSAISKLDYTFLTILGPDLARGAWDVLALDPRVLNRVGAARLAWGFPLGELLAALLLIFPRTRRWGLGASFVMHGILFIVLGPWGLNHEPGVLLWNLYFIGQNWLLFGGEARPVGIVPRRWGPAEIGIAAVLLLPALEPLGWYDHWPAWAVYAPGAERVTLLIDAAAAERLPPVAGEHLGPPGWAENRRVVRTDQWSLAALSAPIYPQGRFRAAVALAIVRRNDLGEAATLVVEGRANRFTGERSRREFRGQAAIVRYAAGYWINMEARQ